MDTVCPYLHLPLLLSITFTLQLARDFVEAFFRLQPASFNGLMQCALSSLTMQERYSLVSACTFLGTLINRTFTSTSPELDSARHALIEGHGRALMRAVLCGFAGTAPRSVTPNLIEILATLLARCPGESRAWMADILFAVSWSWCLTCRC